MPITCRIPLCRLSQKEFGELSYDVMRDVFANHNELGRFFEEDIYKRALAARRHELLNTIELGRQPFRHAAEDVAFKLTAFEDARALDRFLIQVDRLVRHTTLRALLCINIGRSRITFSSVAPKEAGRKIGAGK